MDISDYVQPSVSMSATRAKSRSSLDRAFRRLFVEDAGQDLIEYGLLTGIVIVVGFLVFITIRTKMGAAYVTWGAAILNNWEPSPPSGP